MPAEISDCTRKMPSTGKTAGLLWCAAVGIGFLAVGKFLYWALASYALPVDRPESIPVDWWSVDLRVTNLAAREFIEVGLLAVLLRLRGVRFLDLGFKKPGTKMAWMVALLVLAVGLLSHPFVRNGGPYPLAGYTIFAALMMGIPAALIEESIYRGFAITTLQASGFGMPVQILVPGIIFGLVHVSYVSTDWTVPVFTGILGCVWSWIYIVGRNSIWPTLVAHMINDAVIMPYFYLHHVY